MGISAIEIIGIVVGAGVIFALGRGLYKSGFKPTDQPDPIPNSNPPPSRYGGIYNVTSLGGSRKNRQRKNKSRRR